MAEVIRQIHEKFEGQHGIWSSYVEKHLIPRLNGFELLMASYAMAHLKLDMLLTETGYKPKTDQRLRVYLTNSLEEHHPDTGTLFANWLSSEANEANQIKRDVPVMVVLGNPPYSVSSNNKGEWIEGLVADYKKNLNERNIQPLSDDYIKFIRYGQHYIEKTGEDILAYISNNSFLDGLIHRQMRKHLLDTFDKIYIIDLHGSAKKNETTVHGTKDENVFDIQQGVSINLFVKKQNGSSSKKVYFNEILGLRQSKYHYLTDSTIDNIEWKEIVPEKENYFFVDKQFTDTENYLNWISIKELFTINASGFKTERDTLTIQYDSKSLNDIESDFKLLSEIEIRNKYALTKDGRDWRVLFAKNDLLVNKSVNTEVLYRPFDIRHTLYTGKSKGFLAYPRTEISKNIIGKENISLLTCRQQSTFDFQHVLVTTLIADMCSVSLQTKETSYQFPLYLYLEGEIFHTAKRKPNLNDAIVLDIAKGIGLTFTAEKDNTPGTFAPIDILDYIYAVLHNPTYREKYKEFLKIDFPRIPYPTDKGVFWQLVKLGGELRQIHLLENAVVNKYITKYPVDGSNIVEKPEYKDGKVWINPEQYFEDVPEIAWNFYIGGYQPTQKWLKDRKGRELSIEDIQHYPKIIVALSETDRIMKEIDKIEFI